MRAYVCGRVCVSECYFFVCNWWQATGKVDDSVLHSCAETGIVCLGGVRLRDLLVGRVCARARLCVCARVCMYDCVLTTYVQDLSTAAHMPVVKDLGSLVSSTAMNSSTAVTLCLQVLRPPCAPEALATDDGAMIEFAKSCARTSGVYGDGAHTEASLCIIVDAQHARHVAADSTRPVPHVVILSAPAVPLLRRTEMMYVFNDSPCAVLCCVVLCGVVVVLCCAACALLCC